jgi:hypothetical protein
VQEGDSEIDDYFQEISFLKLKLSSLELISIKDAIKLTVYQPAGV